MSKKLRMLAAAGVIAAFLPAGLARAQDAEKLTMRQAVTLALQNSRDLSSGARAVHRRP